MTKQTIQFKSVLFECLDIVFLLHVYSLLRISAGVPRTSRSHQVDVVPAEGGPLLAADPPVQHRDHHRHGVVRDAQGPLVALANLHVLRPAAAPHGPGTRRPTG